MSLISDALKTAQRERSGQSPPTSEQPLLEGFFPYVSTSTPEGRSKLTRTAVISVSAVAVFAVAVWFGVPAIKRAMDARSRAAVPIAPVQATAFAQPPVQVAQAPDSQRAPALVRDSAPPESSEREPAPRAAVRKPPKRAASEPKEVVIGPDLTPARRDTAIAPPPAALSSVAERRALSAVATRNLETEAIAAYNAGDYKTASGRFAAALKGTPSASLWTNYGVTLEKLGDSMGAMRAYRSAVGIDASYFNAWLYLARVYNLMGDVAQAVPLFDRALKLEPNNSDANADLAELEFKAGAFTEARRYANVAARSNPSNARAHYYLALSADTLKDRDVARRAFEDYLRTIGGQDQDNLASIGYARIRLLALKGNP